MLKKKLGVFEPNYIYPAPFPFTVVSLKYFL